MTLSKRVGFAVCGTLAITVAAALASAHSGPSQTGERTIEGVWQTAVTPRHCQTGQQLGTFVIRGLFTLHQGGTMSEFGVSPGSTPALRSPGHGVWQRLPGWSDYSYAFTFKRYDDTGALIGSQTVRGTAELDGGGDTMTTQSAVQVLNAQNQVVANFCATAVATRFE